MHSIITTLLLSVAVGTGFTPTPTLTTDKIPHESPLSITEPDQLDLYIEHLAFKESSGKETVVIVDTNGKHSRGCLQFQDRTFQAFSEKYHVRGQIMDCAVQKQLAKLILTHEKDGWRHWFTSVTKKGGVGLPPL